MVQARAQATRSRIVRAGAVVFNREGFAGATTADIIREAAVSKGAMQFHFRTKGELAQAVLADYTRHFSNAADVFSVKQGNSLAAAMEVSAVIARQLVEEPVVGAAYRLTMEESAFAPRVTTPYFDALRVFEGFFRAAEIGGELRPGLRINDLARYVVASFIGVQLVSDTLTSRTDLIQRVADMWIFLLPAICAPERLPDQLKDAGKIFVVHYRKSRSDLAAD